MSNPNYTHIVLLVDASGSMELTKQATIAGINNFIESQKRLPIQTERNLSLEDDMSDSYVEIKCTATLATFSSQAGPVANISSFVSLGTSNNGEPAETYYYNKLYDGADILTVPALTSENYDTFGGTPLVDAFHKTITECSGFISRLPEDQRPGRIIVVSITDGEENSSTKFSREQLKQLIETKTAQNWQFIYLGANQDAFTESRSMGVANGQALNFVQDDAGITHGFNCLTSNVFSKRSVEVQYMTAQHIFDLDTSVPLQAKNLTLD